MKWFSWPRNRGLTLGGSEFSQIVHWIRHAFLNDLQVLGGWLQFGRPVEATEYLKRVQSRLSLESQWSALGNPDLEAALFLAEAEAGRTGLTLRVAVIGLAERERTPAAATVAAVAATVQSPTGRLHAAPFAVASLAVLRAAVRLIAATAPAGSRDVNLEQLEATLEVTGGRLELIVSLPEVDALAGDRGTILEADTLGAVGFVPCETSGSAPDDCGVVGIEWRPAGRRAGQSGLSRVAEGPASHHRLVLVAGEEPPERPVI